MKTLILMTILILAPLTHAENFEIIDGAASVSGKPSYSPNQARENWDAACEQWKNETKELNKSDQLMMLSCQTPSCSSDNSEITCSSTAVFKVKTAGTRVVTSPTPDPVVVNETAPSPVIEETVVQAAPPPVIIETRPAPRPGFIWITGYWGWRYGRHYWVTGHWEHHRPGYVYVGARWVSHGHAWHLEAGHWRR